MKAAVFDRYGPAEVLHVSEWPNPAPAANEVLVRIHATVATPSDVAFRSGRPAIVRLFTGLTRPKHNVIGTIFAGVVEAVGAEVTRFRPGDRVHGESTVSFGATAEFKCLPHDTLIEPLPDGLGFAEAVALSDGGMTALPFLREGGVGPGTAFLVNGASGSVGAAAVQLARHLGATVTGVCSGRNAALVESLGAHQVIDYEAEDFTAGKSTYDVVFDAVGKNSFGRCRRALRPGGYYLTTVPTLAIALDMLFRTRGTGRRAKLLTTGLRPVAERRKDLAELIDFVAAGAIRPVIDRTYALEEIVAAHRYVETGRKRGSVVIAVGDPAT